MNDRCFSSQNEQRPLHKLLQATPPGGALTSGVDPSVTRDAGPCLGRHLCSQQDVSAAEYGRPELPGLGDGLEPFMEDNVHHQFNKIEVSSDSNSSLFKD
ncbi:hypothetical protein ACJ73_09371 [Blastomyces percursus]|uniref:Uncharacterized protein n=1 Tax=Blastomyces percursus TaxID=1658174 RepID=A0A1J9P8B8_9EURO|nr:hypothetical protein ACJ73_09371 [Blastomyces percursus]